MAAWMAERSGAGTTVGILARSVERSAGGAGIAGGSCASGGDEAQRGDAHIRAAGKTVTLLAGVESAGRSDAVHDAAGGLCGAAGTAGGAGRYIDWDTDQQSDASGSRRAGGVLCEHGSDPDEPDG